MGHLRVRPYVGTERLDNVITVISLGTLKCHVKLKPDVLFVVKIHTGIAKTVRCV